MLAMTTSGVLIQKLQLNSATATFMVPSFANSAGQAPFTFTKGFMGPFLTKSRNSGHDVSPILSFPCPSQSFLVPLLAKCDPAQYPKPNTQRPVSAFMYHFPTKCIRSEIRDQKPETERAFMVPLFTNR